jgi:hypothetical protein
VSSPPGTVCVAMDRDAGGLEALTRGERAALRAVLVRATAAAGRGRDGAELDRLTAAAPMQQLPAAAALHRVGGTVLRGLDGVDGVPPDVRAALTVMRQQAALSHLVVVGGLSQIRDAFDAAALSWIVMKGPVLASRLYPDVGDRSYGDVDLLVARRDYPRAMAILEDQGYAHTIHNWALAEDMLAGQVGMTNGRVNVDLHWHLHYSGEDRRPFALDPGGMLERRRRADVSGLDVPILDPVDRTLTLSFHAARSDGHRLVWLKDIERSVAVEEPDFDELVRRCRDERCGPPVGMMLDRTRTILGADVPHDVVAALMPAPLRLADRVVCTVADPVQLHERPTITRVFTRSVRSSVAASIADVPTRTFRLMKRRLRPAAENETDSPVEKASYLRAVASASER